MLDPMTIRRVSRHLHSLGIEMPEEEVRSELEGAVAELNRRAPAALKLGSEQTVMLLGHYLERKKALEVQAPLDNLDSTE